ncbi:MAG: hypothetical protein KDN05_19130, partial [Verrucomicrobiae bacterium]|nr:hypothetical protein [Verrucomicrobiae bacterium]
YGLLALVASWTLPTGEPTKPAVDPSTPSYLNVPRERSIEDFTRKQRDDLPDMLTVKYSERQKVERYAHYRSTLRYGGIAACVFSGLIMTFRVMADYQQYSREAARKNR